MSLRPSRAAFVSCLSASLAGFLAGDFQLRAATITARSVSLVDVSAAINSAANGDTVIIPAGTATWLTGLIITKAITLLGQTTVTDTNVASLKYNDQTIIQDGSSTGYVI